MKFRTFLIHGLVAGILAGVVGVVYFELYQYLMLTGFDKLINAGSIIASSVIGCMLMALGYALLSRKKWERFTGWLNVLISALSFASILGPMQMTLPLDIEFPELFPGLVVPMHFFPPMAFFALVPFFLKTKTAA